MLIYSSAAISWKRLFIFDGIILFEYGACRVLNNFF